MIRGMGGEGKGGGGRERINYVDTGLWIIGLFSPGFPHHLLQTKRAKPW